MFSSLLSRPKHSSYDPNYHFHINTLTNENNKVLALQSNIQALDYTKVIDDEQVNYESTIPLKKRYPNLTHNFPRPSLDDPEVQDVIEQTKSIISKLITPEQDTEIVKHIEYNSENIIEGSSDRVIQIRKFQVDPMLPPQFKLRKNRHKPQTAETAPIVKQTSNKLTKEDREKWNIPAVVSNWENNEGFTIDLDKRVMGQTTTSPQVNIEKFGNLSNALVDAEIQAREDIKIRNEIRKRKEENETRERERNLRDLAQRSKRRKY
ncbi:Pre-mRNA-processing protein 45 [Spathaspora sp. JA1]|nr:Pre-mRNA-processing protein 45 [Spathaspora sp. JA1]